MCAVLLKKPDYTGSETLDWYEHIEDVKSKARKVETNITRKRM